MFNCPVCRKTQSRYISPEPFVIKKRAKNYINKIMDEFDVGHIKESQGWEIVEEIKICPSCFKKLNKGEI